MSGATAARRVLNRVLAVANLRLETLTAREAEHRRLRSLEERGHFTRAIFPVPPAFRRCSPRFVLDEVARHAARLEDLREPARNAVGYAYDNPYFRSPDAEVLYAMLRHFQPGRIVEIGSGHSTRVMRQAIIDGQFKCHLTSVDPQPRAEVRGLADDIVQRPLETCDPERVDALEAGDVLFIDSSHAVRAGNDVVTLYLHTLPALRPGVVIQIHDIFLPYEYPQEWLVDFDWPWNEQYLVQAMLTSGDAFEVLWPGHFLQRTLPGFAGHFPHAGARRAQSLWLRKTDAVSPPAVTTP